MNVDKFPEDILAMMTVILSKVTDIQQHCAELNIDGIQQLNVTTKGGGGNQTVVPWSATNAANLAIKSLIVGN